MIVLTSSRLLRESEIACDDLPFERLRTLSKKLADERAVPAYIICDDNTLRAMARYYPTTVAKMDAILGEAKPPPPRLHSH